MISVASKKKQCLLLGESWSGNMFQRVGAPLRNDLAECTQLMEFLFQRVGGGNEGWGVGGRECPQNHETPLTMHAAPKELPGLLLHLALIPTPLHLVISLLFFLNTGSVSIRPELIRPNHKT